LLAKIKPEDDGESAVEVQEVSEDGSQPIPPLPFSSPSSSLGIQASNTMSEADEEVNGTDVLRAFAESAVEALSPKHPHAFLKSITFNKKIEMFTAVIADPNDKICAILMNNDLTVCAILPGPACPPYPSLDFFTNYWQPIVEAIGHFKDGEVVIVPHYNRLLNKQSLGHWRGFLMHGKPATISAKLKPGNQWALEISEDQDATH
jgi:hypothetical protein